MKLWCDRCKEAVEPESYNRYTIPNLNVGDTEIYEIMTCPKCGQEVYQEPGRCVMCGVPTDPDIGLCEGCSEDIGIMINSLAETARVSREAVLDGIAEYLLEE